jgi:hypothetical protein
VNHLFLDGSSNLRDIRSSLQCSAGMPMFGFGQARKRALPKVWWVFKVSLRAWLEESVRALDQAPAKSAHAGPCRLLHCSGL